MAEMQAARGIGEELVAQDALVDLHAVLLGLAQLGLDRNLCLGWRQPGHQRGGVIDQPLDAHEFPPVVGQPVVERAGVAAQEREAGLARGLLQALGGLVVGGVAVRLGGQAGKTLGGVAPPGREDGRVGREVAADHDRRRCHTIHHDVPARKTLERATGFEPATYGLGSRRSTPELHPHPYHSSSRLRPRSNRVSQADAR